MACQTGIRASQSLLETFARCKRPAENVRAIRIIVKDEQLISDEEEKICGDWQKDWARVFPRFLDDKQPAFILFRHDSQSQHSPPTWLLVTYAPDSATTRQKMLLAATRATMKSEFGPGHITDEMHAANQNEANIDTYKSHSANKAAPGPMTEVEYQLGAVKHEERAVQQRHQAARSLASQTLRGVAFPIDQEAQEKLTHVRDGVINYVQLSVDTLNEAIKLEYADNIDIDQLKTLIPRNKPRYHYFRWPHTHDGEMYDSVAFIYSMPAGGCTIKERMLFSSCKGVFIETVEKFIKLYANKKIEIDASEVVDEQFLIDQLHPQLGVVVDNKFSKPKGPPGRGARRMVNPLAGQ